MRYTSIRPKPVDKSNLSLLILSFGRRSNELFITASFSFVNLYLSFFLRFCKYKKNFIDSKYQQNHWRHCKWRLLWTWCTEMRMSVVFKITSHSTSGIWFSCVNGKWALVVFLFAAAYQRIEICIFCGCKNKWLTNQPNERNRQIFE